MVFLPGEEVPHRLHVRLAQRSKLAHVAELAASMREATGGEPMNCVVVQIGQAGAYEVVAGRDRMAALLMLRAQEVWVRVGELAELAGKLHLHLSRATGYLSSAAFIEDQEPWTRGALEYAERFDAVLTESEEALARAAQVAKGVDGK